MEVPAVLGVARRDWNLPEALELEYSDLVENGVSFEFSWVGVMGVVAVSSLHVEKVLRIESGADQEGVDGKFWEMSGSGEKSSFE